MRAARRCRRLPASSARTGPRSSPAWTRASSWGRWRPWATCRARRLGLLREALDAPAAGAPCAGPLRASGAPESGALGERDGVEDPPAVPVLRRSARPLRPGPRRCWSASAGLAPVDPVGTGSRDSLGRLTDRARVARRPPRRHPRAAAHTVAGGGSGRRHRPGQRGAGTEARQLGLRRVLGTPRPSLRARDARAAAAGPPRGAPRGRYPPLPGPRTKPFRAGIPAPVRFLASAGRGAVRPPGARAATG